jgi:hypothetical protein
MSVSVSVFLRNALLDRVAGAVSGNLGHGILHLYGGTQPAVDAPPNGNPLVTFDLSGSSGFPAAVNGATTWDQGGSPLIALALRDGVASHFRLVDGNQTTLIIQGSVTAIGEGGDLEINNVAIFTGNSVELATLNLFIPVG